MEQEPDVMDPDQYDCAGCAYYAPQADGVGSCHRYAPRSRGWPKTTDAGMCGEHSVWALRLKKAATDHLEAQLVRLELAAETLMVAVDSLPPSAPDCGRAGGCWRTPECPGCG